MIASPDPVAAVEWPRVAKAAALLAPPDLQGESA